MTSILILGYGQLAQILEKYFSNSKKYKTYIFKDRIENGKMPENDKLNYFKYDVLINTLAQSNTRICERDWKKSYDINVKFPINLIKKVKYSLIEPPKIIQISSGCIFNGNKKPNSEDSPPTPLIAYSRQKLMAETLRHIYENHVIIRPRMIFSELELSSNLLYKINGFNEFLNEQNSITSAETIAEFIEIVIEQDLKGTFNLCNNGLISPFAIKKLINETLGWDNKPVFIIDKKTLHNKLGLSLTDTWIDSSKAEQYMKIKNAEDELIRVIKKSNWLIKK